MLTLNETVVNLIKSLYDEYNGRPLTSLTPFGLYFELVYLKEDLNTVLNIVYEELCTLKGEGYSYLSSLDDLKKFSVSKGFTTQTECDDEEFLEESLVELCSTRMSLKKRMVRNLVLSPTSDSGFDDNLTTKLNDLKLSETDHKPVEEGNKKRRLKNSELDQQDVESLRNLTSELSKDYFSRWNLYMDRFYNLLAVFFKVNKLKDSKSLRVLVETLKAWRRTTMFRELNIYDLCTYKRLVYKWIRNEQRYNKCDKNIF